MKVGLLIIQNQSIMRTYLSLAIFALVSISIFAQEKTITGKVSDDSGPLPGVSVIIKNSTQGTQTDFDGMYSIKAKVGDKLVFSFVGMRTQEVKIKTSNTINITLKSDHNMLEEVVVVGYAASARKASITASVSSISKIETKLKGKASGVQILSKTDHGNSNKKVIIRGMASVSKQKQPLYILDGLPVDPNSKKFRKLKPNSIKTVNVLKDASASSIYGNRAANGVVIISTQNNQYQSEAYKEIKENEFKHVAFSPLSTFSIDVDKAAYSNVRRYINNGQKVPKDAIKLEEMINYFEYDYKQPTDKHPFSIHTEVANSPWDNSSKIVKIGLQGKNIVSNDIPPSNLVFLIDVSGSMNSTNKLPMLKSAFKLLVNQLRNEDKVSIVVYAGAAGVVLNATSGDNKNKILSALDKLKAGGSTAGGQGIELAYQIAKKNFMKDGNNRIVLATDGDFNVGASSDKAMEELIIEKRKSGIFLTVLGFGMGNYKDSKLETLADKGNGNHAYIDTMQEANRVLGTEFSGTMFTIAKDVKIQVEFNPTFVEAYRLIGYENRMLEDKDFKDDTKDAGELGSNHSVTALYEVIPKGIKSKFLQDIDGLKYTTNSTKESFDNELLTVKFRYKEPKGTKSIELVHVMKNDPINFMQSSTDFKFATAVAMFGMKLRNSKHVEDVTYNDILEIADTSRGKDTYGYRAEFTRLVKMVGEAN